ncbi:MAG: flagellar hook-associated protein FlgL [Pseudomonadota bacterium]
MTGRISSNLLYQLGGRSMMEMQAQAAKTQQQLASGKRILSASDDPNATALIMNLEVSLNQNQQFQRNGETSDSRLAMQDGLLGQMTNTLQRVRELVIQGKNDSNNNDSRRYIATEISRLKDQLLDLANYSDANYGHVFAGSKTESTPFIALAGGGYQYVGDDSQLQVKISHGQNMQVNVSGRQIFMNIANGNGSFYTAADTANTGNGAIIASSISGAFVPDDYTVTMTQLLPTDPITYQVTDSGGGVVASGTYAEGSDITFNGAALSIDGTPKNGDVFYLNKSQHQDVFTTLQNIVDAFALNGDDPANSALMHSTIHNEMQSLDQAMYSVERAHANVGGKLNILERQSDINDTVMLANKKNISTLKDLDYYEAITRYQQQMMSLEAAQRSFLQIQSMNLFSLLR